MMHDKRVLIVDDETEICILLSGIIRKKHMDPFYVHTIADAREALSHEDPRVVFIDINLPDGNGIDLLALLKLNHPNTKIVIISAFDSFKEQAIKKGADKFLSKPFNREAIIEVLNNSSISEPH